VVDERAVDRGDEAIVDPALADLDDGLELVAERAEVAPLLAGQNPRTLAFRQELAQVPRLDLEPLLRAAALCR
jgi:hypothetical protein